MMLICWLGFNFKTLLATSKPNHSVGALPRLGSVVVGESGLPLRLRCLSLPQQQARCFHPRAHCSVAPASPCLLLLLLLSVQSMSQVQSAPKSLNWFISLPLLDRVVTTNDCMTTGHQETEPQELTGPCPISFCPKARVMCHQQNTLSNKNSWEKAVGWIVSPWMYMLRP